MMLWYWDLGFQCIRHDSCVSYRSLRIIWRSNVRLGCATCRHESVVAYTTNNNPLSPSLVKMQNNFTKTSNTTSPRELEYRGVGNKFRLLFFRIVSHKHFFRKQFSLSQLVEYGLLSIGCFFRSEFILVWGRQNSKFSNQPIVTDHTIKTLWRDWIHSRFEKLK